MLVCSVSVTTCPRDAADYLPATLVSLRDAGFTPRVYRDDGWPRAGVKPTWKRALRELIESDPDAEAYAMFQDDCLISKGLAGWLQWPEPPEGIGVVSLYCAGPLHRDETGWFPADLSAPSRGAVAYLMPAESARTFLRDDPGRESRTVLDHTMADWCRANGLTYWLHSPSLVQHVGEVSAVCPPRASRPHKFGLLPARVAKVFCEDVRELEVVRA